MRLHVDPVAPEKRASTLASQIFGLVHLVAAPVVPPAGEALRVFVRQRRSHRLQHSPRNEILGRNQFDTVILALNFSPDGPEDGGVLRGKVGHARYGVDSRDSGQLG